MPELPLPRRSTRPTTVMTSLSVDASMELLRLIRVSYFSGIAGWTVTLDRLTALRDLSEPTDPSRQIAVRILEMECYQSTSQWEGIAHEPEKDAGYAGHEPSEPDGSMISFQLRNIAALRAWHFRIGDPDPFPAVPHGHWHNQPKPKLDPYLGWVYDGTRQTRREPRSSIVQLWNDHRFRRFAAKAIQLFIASNPHFGGWRVGNPFKLPRRRRP